MRIEILLLYFNAIRHLRSKQLYYQVFYRIRKTFRKEHFKTNRTKTKKGHLLRLQSSIQSARSYDNGEFQFLNKRKAFPGSVNWDFRGYGKLWAYNLNYFDFLNQHNLRVDQGLKLINDFCSNIGSLKEAWEPYTISLRGINWIKFFAHHPVANAEVDQKLYSQYQHLASNLEYHLLGNHLLENGFSLLFGAYYFQDDSFYRTAQRILRAELDEQVLSDGGHFELSPMYHQILLFRLLDAINLVRNNTWKNHELLPLLRTKAGSMLGWLRAVTFKNGNVPMVNDAAFGIAPSSCDLFGYAASLSIGSNQCTLSDSGYRMIVSEDSELFIDVGNIGPDYIPGHAHSDTFNFLLHINGQPIIVDTGTSTYDAGVRRQTERSTSSHNTVVIDNREQSEVWGSFRVGRRAKVIHLESCEKQISAAHDGYKALHLTHRRTWRWSNANKRIDIADQIEGRGDVKKAVAMLHFHPSVQLKVGNSVVTAGPVIIKFENQLGLECEDYEYAAGFNRLLKGQRLKIFFGRELVTSISWSGP